MVFNSIIFLFFFLPFTLATYFLVPNRFKNYILLILSLFFYAWGEGTFVILMLISIFANYLIGLLIDYYRGKQSAKLFFWLGVVLNLGFLGYYKYANFLADNVNALWGHSILKVDDIHLPIGISFFTFQAMSYMMDVYWKTANVQRNPLKVGLYIALFPQLIAGPIVRYHDIDEQLAQRSITLNSFTQGIYRFALGLGKKVLIANVLAVVVDEVFASDISALGAQLAWFALIAYALQIYFDFSGYSDMAIGLGMMFGFTLPENFNFPYTAKSIQDFWQRWHISASTWFRLYLFSPLSRSLLRRWGVQRRTQIQILSTLVVMLLIGLWHGASWNFVIWGGIFGIALALEQVFLRRHLNKLGPIQYVYTLFIVLMAWVFFRAEDIDQAFTYFTRLFSFASENPEFNIHRFIDRETILTFSLAIIFSSAILPKSATWLQGRLKTSANANQIVEDIITPLFQLSVIASLMLLSLLSIAAGVYSPFIYFRF